MAGHQYPASNIGRVVDIDVDVGVQQQVKDPVVEASLEGIQLKLVHEEIRQMSKSAGRPG